MGETWYRGSGHMPEELCQVSPKSHYVSLALHFDPSPFNAEERYESEFLYDQKIKRCVTIILSHSSIPAILNFSFEKRDQLSSGESLSR